MNQADFYQESGGSLALTIDGYLCRVPVGSTILEAAGTLGIDIPTLCYLKQLAPDGACRLCVVEVEGGRKGGLPAACTEKCTEGMKVWTLSPRVVEARRFVLDLLLSRHDFQCFKCGRNGSCKLQDYALAYGLTENMYAKGQGISAGLPDVSHPLFTFKPGLCVMCRRCTRVCEKLQGRDVISISRRGASTRMSPAFGLPWAESDCESCGNCVSYCPTGALTSRDNTKSFRAWEVERVRTTCPHCGTGCQYDLLVKQNRLVGVEPADGPANGGLLCVKGKFGSYKFVHSPERLRQPLIRREGILEPASWDEALDLVADRFRHLIAEHGSDAVAGFSCARATNEDNYVFQKMVRAVFGTNNVDNCARVCHSASVHGLSMTLGSGAMTNSIRDITREADVILLIGSNPTEAHPVVGAQIRQALLRGAKLIVVDPRKIDLTKQATVHLQIRPGTNVAFANGMMHVILREGLADREFIEKRTEGFEEVERLVAAYTPERVAEICRIDPEDLRQAAILYAQAERAPIIYCLGVTEHSSGTEGVMSLSNIAMLVGKIGKPGCGVNPLRGQNNVQGACDMGALPYDFPGYQKVANPDVREKFARAWGVPMRDKIGLTATQVIPAAREGLIKGLYIFGEDPMVTDPDTAHVREALEGLEFLVVQELFLTETAALADVVLPGVSYAEKEGTFVNTERRVQRVRRAVTLDGDMKQDYEIICEIMTRMGYPCRYESAAAIMDEIASVVPIYGGISHERLDAAGAAGLQWPCPDPAHRGTSFLHEERFSRGLGLFYPAEYREAKEMPDGLYPLTMVTGRMLYHYNARAMTGRTEGINALANTSYIEMNAGDALLLGVGDGDRVVVASRRGEIETTARVGDVVSPGEVFMTFHFPDGNVNKLTNPALDEIAWIPEYKVCAVRVTPA
ncbi:MAG: formate dehydrogenase subunit alpha [Peptococcaceae bacterium]|nr:formate dehydrogenase subunit alpha [Peptococcaceae bacterium]